MADYPFTTLEPNLGVLEKIIIADIPGLIEGASSGKGLGIKFLRHIKRTKVLLHCISLDSKNIEKDWKIVRRELANFHSELGEKKEIMILTKADLLKPDELEDRIKKAKKINKDFLVVSVHDWDSLEALKKRIKDLAG